MLNRRIVLLLAGAAFLLAGSLTGQVISTPPNPTPPNPGPPVATPPATPVKFTLTYSFLPVGVASSETVQINVVNTAQEPAAGPAATANSCGGTISFFNAGGSVIGKPVTFTLTPGQIFSASLPYGSLGVTGAARTVVRGQVQVTQPPFAVPNAAAAAAAPCSLLYSLETFDTATGVTHVLSNSTSSAGFAVPLLAGGITPAPAR